MNDKIFANGMMFMAPNDNAPDWVYGKIHIKVKDFVEFIQAQENERGWVNLDVLRSKKGGYYVQLNTYKKVEENKFPNLKAPAGEIPVIEDDEVVDVDKIPFN